MRYVVRTGLAMALFAFCWVAFAYGIYQLLQIGTCASGGPYVVARECPEGTERIFYVLPISTILLFVAAGIYLGRGTPPGSSRPPSNGGIIVWFWTGLFWSLAVGCFLGIWGPEANPGPGGELGVLIVGVMGALFGAGGLVAVNLGRRGGKDPQRRVRPVVGKVARAASRVGGSDPAGRLDTLDRLRRQGTLTDAEFETLKARIVAGED